MATRVRIYPLTLLEMPSSFTFELQTSFFLFHVASAIVVRLGPRPVLCKTDELGEICLAADYTGSGYWGLRGQTGAHFHVEPVNEDGTPVHSPGSVSYTRSGFLGFPGPVTSVSVLFLR